MNSSRFRFEYWSWSVRSCGIAVEKISLNRKSTAMTYREKMIGLVFCSLHTVLISRSKEQKMKKPKKTKRKTKPLCEIQWKMDCLRFVIDFAYKQQTSILISQQISNFSMRHTCAIFNFLQIIGFVDFFLFVQTKHKYFRRTLSIRRPLL